jgi:hypothetical protein
LLLLLLRAGREGQCLVARENGLLSGAACLWGPLLAGPWRCCRLEQLLSARRQRQCLLAVKATCLVVSG